MAVGQENFHWFVKGKPWILEKCWFVSNSLLWNESIDPNMKERGVEIVEYLKLLMDYCWYKIFYEMAVLFILMEGFKDSTK